MLALPRPGGDGAGSAIVPLATVRPGDSPRRQGVDETHAAVLAEVDAPLPPILVHRATGEVVDGMHRLRAATLRGDRSIAVRYVDGDRAETFVRAVQENIDHGLPLTRSDREAAAVRILRSYPAWSDRAVAHVTGLSPSTVGRIRRRSTDSAGQSNARRGRDGRVRPLDAADARMAASRVIRARPDASLRAVAREAGVSVSTARDVRERLRRGEDPVPAGLRRASGTGRGRRTTAAERVAGAVLARALGNLQRDAAMRSTQDRRQLVEWLGACVLDDVGAGRMARAVPPHCRAAVAVLARDCAARWSDLADRVEAVAARPPPLPGPHR